MTDTPITLPPVRVVLVETSHPGNIGAAARAMKTMGLDQLYLVRPKKFPDAEATARASGADDLLYNAVVCDDFAEAIGDCHTVFGASARQRSIPWPLLDPREAAQKIVSNSGSGEAAVVFGREQWGLRNEELSQCNFLVTIPANPEYSSLNLAMSVQVMSYELRMAALGDVEPAPLGDAPLAGNADVEQMYAHLERAMLHTGFLDPENPRHLMRRLRRLFSRAQLDQNEVNIMRGLLASIEADRD